jgi:hypothetical protein
MCGRTTPEIRLSREHILPRSLRDTISASPGEHTATEAIGPDVAGLEYADHRRPTDLMDVVVRNVCTECNNGWMSDVEKRANPILRRLIAGAEVLTVPEVDAVRHWAAKTATVVQMAAPGNSTPPVAEADRAAIRLGDIPPAWVVTATRLDPSWREHTHTGRVVKRMSRIVNGEEVSERYHLTTIELGQMFLTVTGGPPDSDASADVCQMAVTHLWQVVPAIWTLFPGEAASLATWHLPSADTIQQLTLRFARLLSMDDVE